MDKFTVGQRVMWTSSSNGTTRTKVGIVEAVVPAGQYPDKDEFRTLYSGAGVGMDRDHESYVVRCMANQNGGKGGVYWPRVNKLRTSI